MTDEPHRARWLDPTDSGDLDPEPPTLTVLESERALDALDEDTDGFDHAERKAAA